MVIPVGKESGKNVGIGINFVDYGRQIVRTAEMPEGTGATFGAHDLSMNIICTKINRRLLFWRYVEIYPTKNI